MTRPIGSRNQPVRVENKLSVIVTAHEIDQLRAIAARQGVSMAALVRGRLRTLPRCVRSGSFEDRERSLWNWVLVPPSGDRLA